MPLLRLILDPDQGVKV